MKKRNLLVLLATAALMTACGTNPSDPSSGGGGGGGGGGSASAPEGKITVNFYIDYNAGNANTEFNLNGDNTLKTYAVQYVDNGAKVSKPADPTEAPFEEFPVFLGWSRKEVIDNKNDLWNFDSDTVSTETGSFSIFAIWVAQGEN